MLFGNSKLSNNLYKCIWGVSNTKGFMNNLSEVEDDLFPSSG